ncbi:hypothetical protein BBK14_11220 [Parafrankia soli]|uniref:Uncharacterized protein n=1 Tax=Parafrankia soli TaxID=2599596 RepID=A0A1S1R9L2_9ACTN|nr:hypothetical protein [Parafrankia soli]OHV42185.1 hypothetical protein BBK14_11220 [Parafrankia soli]
MSNPYRDRLLGVGVLRRGRTRDQVREGRAHPETGVPYKATTDQLGTTTTEHATRDNRVDVLIRAPHVELCAQQKEIRHV